MELFWFMIGIGIAIVIWFILHLYRRSSRVSLSRRIVNNEQGTFEVDNDKWLPLCSCDNCMFTRLSGGYMPCLRSSACNHQHQLLDEHMLNEAVRVAYAIGHRDGEVQLEYWGAWKRRKQQIKDELIRDALSRMPPPSPAHGPRHSSSPA
jgi:hypothetical protein